MTRPVRLGISANFFHADPQRPLFKGKTLQYLEERMALSCRRAGAVPLLLTDLQDEAGSAAVLDVVDGLVLSGGADVAPGSYGETPLQPQWGGDAVRDAYETRLIEMAIERGQPVLGLCRGIQILNVALGGTLLQDINTQVEGTLVHRDWEPYDELSHDVRVEAGSWVSEVYGGATELTVNTIHHQAIKDVAPSLTATAWAPDGIIEAVEHIDDARWLVGIQWHPEWLEAREGHADPRQAATKDRASGDPVFATFVAACRERR